MNKHPLHHFETFLWVAQSGSFTVAAKKLAISKAAVSNAIRLLEESLKTPLFIRTTRSIRLTQEGELLLRQCKKIKKEIDAATELVSGFSQLPTGHLRISCNPYFAENLLANIVKQYMQRYPDVSFEILSEERMPDMANEQVDIVFGINWPPPQDIVARPIGETRYVICASPEYLRLQGMPQTIKDLESHNYIPHLGRSLENTVVNLKQKTTFNMHTNLKLNSAHFMKVCALNDLGIIQLHDYMVTKELSEGRLIEILKSYSKPAIPLYIYYQKHRFVQPKIKKFVELVFQML